MPLVSVVLPVYNTEQYIAASVQSILDQTFTDFELLIINDASTDNTLHILEAFDDPRLKIVNNSTNLKVVKSLNKGLDLAQGEFIARMDADDISFPQRFERQLNFLQKNPDIDVCGSWVQGFGEVNYPYLFPENPDDLKAALLFLNVIIHPSVMFRKNSFNKHGLRYQEAFTNAEDYGLWVDAIDKLKFANVPEILLKYRIHQSNLSFFNASNFYSIKEMNCKAYTQFLTKMGISFTDGQLLMHFKFGFKIIDKISEEDLKSYLNWLITLVKANKKSCFINTNSLLNEITKLIAYVFKKAPKSFASSLLVLKALSGIATIPGYIAFAKYRINRRIIFKKRTSSPEYSAIIREIIAKGKAQAKQGGPAALPLFISQLQ